MILKLLFISILCVFGSSQVLPQQVDSLNIAGSDVVDTNFLDESGSSTDSKDLSFDANQQKLLFAEKYDLNLDNGISSKMLIDRALHESPDLNSPDLGFVIKQNEKVYAYKYFPDQRCWLINYKSFWGFVEDYSIMAVKEESFTSYKDQWDVPPKTKTSLKPKYPKEAKKAGIEGSVEVKIFINEKGVVVNTIIIKGIDGLNDAAIEAINKVRFEPAKKNGKKISVWVPSRIKFKL